MKPALLLCLIGMTSLTSRAIGQSPQPFTAVVWTTTTLHTASGKSSTFMQRTVYTRDASGNVRREIYQPTKGLQHDMTAPLGHVVTGFSSAQSLPSGAFSNEKVVQEVDLGQGQFFGQPATGRRQTLYDTTGQHTHTLETWFSAPLGLTVRVDSRNDRGDIVVSDLSELHLGNPDVSSAGVAPTLPSTVPLLILYRALFTHIAHMERDRQANNPTSLVNMEQIEANLSQQLGLPASAWQSLVDTSVRVDRYTQEMSKQAHSVATTDRSARRNNSLSASTVAVSQAKLHAMRTDFNSHVQGEIEQLGASVGQDATRRIEAYLRESLATSISSKPMNLVRLQARQTEKGQTR